MVLQLGSNSSSVRGDAAGKPNDKLFFWEVLRNLWHPDTNPSGFLSLGVAENPLMHESFIKHTTDSFTFTLRDLTYGDGTTGSNRLKVAIARFLTKHLHAVAEIAATHVTVTNGCSSSIKDLSWAIANTGEGILLGQPYCRGFVASIGLQTSVNVVPVLLHPLTRSESAL